MRFIPKCYMFRVVMLMQLCRYEYPDIQISRGMPNFADPVGDFYMHTHTR